MILISFNHTAKEAFRHGFRKGLCAPLLLYGQFEQFPIAEAQPLEVTYNAAGPARDWRMVGKDLDAAIQRYGTGSNGSV